MGAQLSAYTPVYKFKLEQNVSGRIISIDKIEYAVISISLKNVGLSKIDLQREGSGVKLDACEEKAAIEYAQNVKWREIGLFPVLEKHEWIESGEPIYDELLFVLPQKKFIAYRARFRIIANEIQRDVFKIIERKIPK